MAGRADKVVITTFITGDFSRGPWTNAVQGPKLFKIFISVLGEGAYKLNWHPMEDLLPPKGARGRKNDGAYKPRNTKHTEKGGGFEQEKTERRVEATTDLDA